MVQLSLAAHGKALARRDAVPAERKEWMHLRMRVVDGVPAFDEHRMRPDQRDELIYWLEHYISPPRGDAAGRGVRDAVADYMSAYGRFGLRLQDVCEEVEANKKIVLKYLRELVDAGTVRIKEEATRGAGSKRKRYIWVGNQLAFGGEDYFVEGDDPEFGTTDLVIKNDDWRFTDATGIHNRIHGCPVHALSCPSRCSLCDWAVEQALVGEAESAERRAGGTGFYAGLDARTDRRVRDEREFASAIVRGHALRAAAGARDAAVPGPAGPAGDAAVDAGAADGS